MVLSMKDNGKMMTDMAMVKKHWLTNQFTMDIIQKEWNMDKVAIFCMMSLDILVNGMKIKSMEKANIDGTMAENSMETGRIIKWKDLVNTHGQTEGVMLVTIFKI